MGPKESACSRPDRWPSSWAAMVAVRPTTLALVSGTRPGADPRARLMLIVAEPPRSRWSVSSWREAPGYGPTLKLSVAYWPPVGAASSAACAGSWVKT